MGIVSRLSTAALLILASAGVAPAQQDVSGPSAEMQKRFAEACNKGDLGAVAAAAP